MSAMFFFSLLFLVARGVEGFESSPCFTQCLIDPESEQSLHADQSYDDVYLLSHDISQDTSKITMCYFIDADYPNYYIALLPYGYPDHYLMIDGSSNSVIIELNTDDITSITDPRLHRSDDGAGWPSQLTFAMGQMGKYLYAEWEEGQSYVGYQGYPEYPWKILPACSYTGTSTDWIYGYGGSSRRRRAVQQQLSVLPDNSLIVSFDNSSRLQTKQAASIYKTDIDTLAFTVYTSMQTSYDKNNVKNIKYTTEQAVVFFNEVEQRYLVPLVNSTGQVVESGNWRSTNSKGVMETVTYGDTGTSDLTNGRAAFIDITERKGLKPILTRDIKEQRFLDERFFYVKESGTTGFYRLQLANQHGDYLAMLYSDMDKSWQLVATKLKDEQSGVVSFLFALKLPEETVKPIPPQSKVDEPCPCSSALPRFQFYQLAFVLSLAWGFITLV